jgi:hypothetical protein
MVFEGQNLGEESTPKFSKTYLIGGKKQKILDLLSRILYLIPVGGMWNLIHGGQKDDG